MLKISPGCYTLLWQGIRQVLYKQPLYFHWMTLSKVITYGSRGESKITKWLPDHNNSLKWPENVQNHPQNVTFHSVRRPNRCYIVNQPLFFNKWHYGKLLGLERGLLHHKVPPPTTKAAWIGERTSKITSKMSRSAPSGDPTGCYISNQPLYFQEMTLSKVIRAQEGVPTSQSGSPITNMAWIGYVNKWPAKIAPKMARSALSEDPTGVTLVINHSIFIKWP